MPGSAAIASGGGVPFGLNVRAWVLFDGSNGAIVKQFNVSAVARTGTGAYTLTLTAAMPDLHVVGSAVDSAVIEAARNTWNAVVIVNTVSSLRVLTFVAGVATDSNRVWVGVYG